MSRLKMLSDNQILSNSTIDLGLEVFLSSGRASCLINLFNPHEKSSFNFLWSQSREHKSSAMSMSKDSIDLRSGHIPSRSELDVHYSHKQQVLQHFPDQLMEGFKLLDLIKNLFCRGHLEMQHNILQELGPSGNCNSHLLNSGNLLIFPLTLNKKGSYSVQCTCFGTTSEKYFTNPILRPWIKKQ